MHERRHYTLLHFADLLLMQLAKIVFWFHPLAYAYNKHLLLVHEFQADKVSAQEPQQYGQFLVEQALLQTAPVLSHSFNRSPIKKRIVMLTRKSTAAARTKMLVFIPLAMVCFIFFAKDSFSQKASDKTIQLIHFGVSDTALKTHVTYDEVLANLRIMCNNPACEVVDFQISFLPKGEDFWGPFTTKGPKIKQEQIDFIKKHKDDKNPKMMIYIENIHIKVDGVIRNAPTKIFICGN